MNKAEEALLWVIGALDELTKMGLMESKNGRALNPKGTASFDQVDATGGPDDVQLKACLEFLSSNLNWVKEDEIEDLFTVMEAWRDPSMRSYMREICESIAGNEDED